MVDYRISQGFDFNYFKIVSVSSATFGDPSDGYLSDAFIWFPSLGLSLITYGTSTNTVEYSFNGFTVHGELVPSTGSSSMMFSNRPGVSKIWLRVKSGSSGPINVRVESWGIR